MTKILGTVDPGAMHLGANQGAMHLERGFRCHAPWGADGDLRGRTGSV
ncbi:MAG: hypothetical protein RLZZ232_3668, partial [Planctomycetota bacterium]